MPPKKPTKPKRNQKQARSSARRMAVRPRKSSTHQTEDVLRQLNATLEQQVADRTAALRKNEERLRLAMLAANCGTFDWDIPAKKVIWSTETERMWGLPIGGFEGTYEHWRRLVHPDDVAEAERKVLLSLEHPDIPYAYDHRCIRPDGTVRWIHAKATIVCDAAGQPIRMVGVNADITDRKRAEEALQQAQDLLQETEQIGHVGGWEIDIDTRKQTWTDEVYRIHEVSREFEPTVDKGIAFYAPESRPTIERVVQRAIELGEPFDVELKFITAKGNPRWVHAIGKLDLKNRRVHGFFHDITDRKEAEEALQKLNTTLKQQVAERTVELCEREALTRAFLDNHATIAWMKDEEGRHVYLSPTYEKRFGVRFEDWQGKTDFDLWTREIAEQFRSNDLTVLKQNDAIEVVEEVQHPDGSRSWWLNHKFPYQDSSGKKFVGGLGVDITARKQAEEAMHALQARQHLLLTATPVVLYACRATGDYGATFVSENVEEQLGYRPQDYTDHSDFWISHIHPDDRPLVPADLAQVFEQGQHVHEYRFRHHDGTYRWLHDERRLIRDQAGIPVELVGFQIDVTKRKHAEEALRRSEAFTASVVDNLPNMLFVKDAKDLQFVRVNKAAERLLGYRERELLGKDDYDFFPENEADFFTAKDREVLAHGQLLDIPEEPIKTRSGVTRLLHTKKIPLFDRGGHPQYLLGISEDITDRKRAEEALHAKQVELERSQAQLQGLTAKLITAQEAERQRLARDLHDDITQRLAALTIDLGNLRIRESDSNESTLEDIERLRGWAKQLTTDVQRLSHQLHPTVLDHLGLEEAVREHVEEFAARTGLTTQVVTRRLPPTIPLQHATCLYRVLQESLQNVHKHANATSVLVRLLKTPQGLGLCVHDDGRGFEHAQETKRSSGLGLSSMAERVGILKGTFRIRTKPGDGTEIHASIPLEPHEASREAGGT